LTVQLWNEGTLGFDDLIGSSVIDLENLLFRQLREGMKREKEWYDLLNESSRVAQGKISLRMEVLTEEQARRQKAEELVAPSAEEFELRMVLWLTKDVRPLLDRPDMETNQRIVVTANFDNAVGKQVRKQTDVAWYSSGKAEWNYRMKWRLRLPTKLPRLRIQMWDENLIAENDLIGELLLNLQPFFSRSLRDKKNKAHQPQDWYSFSHPTFRELNLGQLSIEMWLLSATEADRQPVGEAQEEPNQDPYLPDPKRNPPPWALGTRGLDWLQKRKALMVCVVICLFVLPLVIPLLVTGLSGHLP